MYKKFWELAGKTKKIMAVYLPILILLSFINNYFTIEIDIKTVSVLEYIKSNISSIIFMMISGLLYVPVAGFILEHLFDSNKKPAGYYIKTWYLQNIALGCILYAIYIAIMSAGIAIHQPVLASFAIIIISLFCSKLMFYLLIAINENVSILDALGSSWKRVSYGKVFKTLWNCFLTFLPFLIAMFIAIPLFALLLPEPQSADGPTTIIFSLIITIISLAGAWYASLTFFVNYWQLLIDEGKIAKLIN
ncbi:MAG: hypothetical protein J5706_07735 [Elusimicrobiales bacterium]|nr:hypothetical protein [Elusimicrobiales bacterium]